MIAKARVAQLIGFRPMTAAAECPVTFGYCFYRWKARLCCGRAQAVRRGPAGGWQPPLRRIWSMVPGGRRAIRLLTSVWRRRLGNVFSCAPGSRRAFLRRWHMRPVQCPRERQAAGSRPYEGQRRLCRPPFTGSAARGCDFAAASGGGKREDRRTEKTSWARPGRPPQKIHNNTVEKNGPIW